MQRSRHPGVKLARKLDNLLAMLKLELSWNEKMPRSNLLVSIREWLTILTNAGELRSLGTGYGLCLALLALGSGCVTKSDTPVYAVIHQQIVLRSSARHQLLTMIGS